MRHESPRELALRILALAAHEPARDAHPHLEPFQAEALARLRAILDRYRGAILADSVGLGKTHVAVELITEAIAAHESVVVTAPASLRAHWSRHLSGLRAWRWLSHTALSRGAAVPRSPPALVVVDEAHAFRNASTRRYAAVALLCEHSRVLLLTATPVNNSLLDFQHLVRLFAPRDAFIECGVPDLDAAVDSALRGGSATELRRVAEAVMVRRTRSALTHAASSGRLRFPECAPLEHVRYDSAHADLVERALHGIRALRFTAHGNGDRAARELMRIGLLKRLESGHAALHASLRRHIRLLEQFTRAADAGLLFRPHTDSTSDTDVDGWTQLTLDPLTLPPWPADRDRTAALADAARDIHTLRELSSLVAAVGQSRDTTLPTDPKLARLHALLDTDLADETVLLFTEYRETARALWRSLSALSGVALIHGSDARLGRGRSTRRAIIERFAPIANRARPPRAAERVRILIATDVLAEGLNLQDARVVISYDMPWNPVRLAQRIGRIDRLGSPHERIRTLAFVPDRGLDELLGLMRRLRRKLRHIRVVGGDAPWSLGRTRERTVIASLDAAAEARAAALARCREIAPIPLRIPAIASHAATPAFSSAVWSKDYGAALCCFRVGTGIRLVLIAEDHAPELDTAACWTALRDALDAASLPTPAEGARQCARAAAATALRALAPRPPAPSRPGRGAALAGTAVLRWLAARPGGPSPDETRTADDLLRRLAASSRAGTDLRLEHIIRAAPTADIAVRHLLREFPPTEPAAEHPAPPSPADQPPALLAILTLKFSGITPR